MANFGPSTYEVEQRRKKRQAPTQTDFDREKLNAYQQLAQQQSAQEQARQQAVQAQTSQLSMGNTPDQVQARAAERELASHRILEADKAGYQAQRDQRLDLQEQGRNYDQAAYQVNRDQLQHGYGLESDWRRAGYENERDYNKAVYEAMHQADAAGFQQQRDQRQNAYEQQAQQERFGQQQQLSEQGFGQNALLAQQQNVYQGQRDERHVDLAARLNQIQLTQSEQARLVRMRNQLSSLEDPSVASQYSPSELQAMRTELQTGINPLQIRSQQSGLITQQLQQQGLMQQNAMGAAHAQTMQALMNGPAYNHQTGVITVTDPNDPTQRLHFLPGPHGTPIPLNFNDRATERQDALDQRREAAQERMAAARERRLLTVQHEESESMRRAASDIATRSTDPSHWHNNADAFQREHDRRVTARMQQLERMLNPATPAQPGEQGGSNIGERWLGGQPPPVPVADAVRQFLDGVRNGPQEEQPQGVVAGSGGGGAGVAGPLGVVAGGGVERVGTGAPPMAQRGGRNPLATPHAPAGPEGVPERQRIIQERRQQREDDLRFLVDVGIAPPTGLPGGFTRPIRMTRAQAEQFLNSNPNWTRPR